jgi:hypothetical protein
MMFGGDDDSLGACRLRDPAPLPAIQLGWIEYCLLLIAFAPFEVRKGVGAEVDE